MKTHTLDEILMKANNLQSNRIVSTFDFLQPSDYRQGNRPSENEHDNYSISISGSNSVKKSSTNTWNLIENNFKKKNPYEITEADMENDLKALNNHKSKINCEIPPLSAKYKIERLQHYDNKVSVSKKMDKLYKYQMKKDLNEKNWCNFPKPVETYTSKKKIIEKEQVVILPPTEKEKDGSFLYDHFGKEKLQEEAILMKKEIDAFKNNQKLQSLLISHKPNFNVINLNEFSQEEEEELDTVKSIEGNNAPLTMEMVTNDHINPLKRVNEKTNYYKYFSFTEEEILEKVLNFDFFRGGKSFIYNVTTIPDTFDCENHYKYVWIINYYTELKQSLLCGRVEAGERWKYKDMNVKVSFAIRNTPKLRVIDVFTLTPNKKLSTLKKRLFKENDILAFYLEEEISIESDEQINLSNIHNLPYFIGIVTYEKSTHSDINDIICKVHSDYSEMIHLQSNSQFSIKLLGNLTSSIREYNAILAVDSTQFSNLLINPAKTCTSSAFKTNLNENTPTTTTQSHAFITTLASPYCKKFNESQKEAILRACNMKTKDILLIQGPPGTGKTHTIIGLLSLFLLNNDGKILICAPSNTAIDEIAARIAKHGVLNQSLQRTTTHFIRFGLYDRLEKENKYLTTENGKILQKYSLEKLSEDKFAEESHNISNQIDKLETAISDLEAQAEQKKALNCAAASKQLDELLHILGGYKKERHNLKLKKQFQNNNKKDFEKELIEKSPILCTTLNSAGHDRLKSLNVSFEYLIVDEACQSVEPSALIPLTLNIKKVVMVGDHMQLPATVFSDKAVVSKYNRSLFERLIDNRYPRHVLTIQYRMHENIREFVGKTFYDGKLRDFPPAIDELNQSSLYRDINCDHNFSFFDLKFGREKLIPGSKSYANETEVAFVIKLIQTIHELVDDSTGHCYKYAIIAPYKAQVKAFYDAILDNIPQLANLIEVNTVDSFQGREQEIVIISTVRSNFNSGDWEKGNSSSGIGFLNDYRRMNVALSRAKLACFIVGNARTLIHNEYWQKLIQHCIEKKNLFPIRENYLGCDNQMACASDVIINCLKFGKIVMGKRMNGLEDGEVDDGMSNNNISQESVEEYIRRDIQSLIEISQRLKALLMSCSVSDKQEEKFLGRKTKPEKCLTNKSIFN